MAFSTFSSIGSSIRTKATASAPAYSLTDIIDTTNMLYFYKYETGDVTNNKLLNYVTNTNDLQSVGSITQTSIKKSGTGASTIFSTASGDSNYSYTTTCPVFSNTAFSISLWVYTSTASPSGNTMAMWNCHSSSVETNPNLSTHVGSGQELSLRSYFTTGNTGYTLTFQASTGVLFTKNTYPLNSWVHMVCVRSGSETKFYVNNVLESTITTNPTLFAGPYTFFSTLWDMKASGRRCVCNIDNLRIYNRALTVGEVETLYGET